MRLLLLALALLCWPGAALAKFAPVDGQALRYSVAEERAGGRFLSERRIVFRKTATGYTAELTIVSADAAGGERDVGAMARRVLGALVGRVIHYELDAGGRVTTVADQESLIATIIAAFGAMGDAGKDASPERRAVAARAAAAIGAMSYEAQRALLASLLTPVIGGALSEAPTGEGPVTLPASSPMSQSVELKGRQTVKRGAGGRVVIDIDVTGTTTPSAAAEPAMMRVVRHSEIDAATGLMLVNDRRTDTWLAGRPNAITTVRTTATLSPVS